MDIFAAVGLVAMVYDHLLTVPDELKVVWGNKNVSGLSKLAFAVNRYMTEGVIAYTVYGIFTQPSHLFPLTDANPTMQS